MKITTCMMMKQCASRVVGRLAAVVLFLAATSPAAAQTGSSFTGLGDLPGGRFRSDASGVSADGSVVVGSAISAFQEAFRWTAGGGMVGLGDLPGGRFESRASGVSADGSVVVGGSNSASGGEAYRWTAGGGMVGLGDLPGGFFFSEALGVSGDGSVVVGFGQRGSGFFDREAFRWTAGGGMVGLGDLPGRDFFSEARAVSADGSVVVGRSFSASGTEAFRWTTGGAMVGLGDLPGANFGSNALAVSGDGSVVVGIGKPASGIFDNEAFRWTAGGGMVGLGDLPGGLFFSEARAVSADGSVVVGFGYTGSGVEAFIWDVTNGMRSLKQVLEDDAGLDLTGWRLCCATGISADGLVIVGNGRIDGNSEAWRAQLGSANHGPLLTCPEPVAAQCSETGGATITLVAEVFDADGDTLDITWHITAPNGTVTTVNDVVAFANPPVPVEVTLSRLFPLGLSEVSITVDDGIAETEACSPVTVCVEDTAAPIVATLQNLVEVGNDAGKCIATLNYDQATSPFAPMFSDVCSPNASATNNAPESFPVGETVVTWTLSDGNGNSVQVTQTVVVTDGEAPDILAPVDFEVPHDLGVCVATEVLLGEALATDNCAVVDIFNDAPDFFGLGDTDVTWYAVDAEGNVMTAIQVVTVTNSAPVADAGADTKLECDSSAGRIVTLNGTGTSDSDDPPASLSFQWSAVGITFDDDTSLTPQAQFPIGSTTVALTVTDPCGAQSVKDVIIIVEDTSAPTIDLIVADRIALWPRKHQIVSVKIVMLISDTCLAPDLLIVNCKVSSNEPDDADGDGSSTGDVNGQDGFTDPVPVSMSFNASTGQWEGTMLLRAERDGDADGRKYSVTCVVEDLSGNTTTATLCVIVPHDQRGRKGHKDHKDREDREDHKDRKDRKK